jgi:ParB/RepB/Spo0J family partition protein
MPSFKNEGTRKDQIFINPAKIKVEANHNPRDYSLLENREHLDNLKVSIKTQGVLQPLWVRYNAGDIWLVDGECRLRAVQELITEGVAILEVPTKLVSANDLQERALLALTANAGKPLTKWEAGSKYRQLRNWGWSDAAIAARVAQSERYVREAIELGEAPQEVKQMMSAGVVTERAALKTVRDWGTASVAILTEKVAVAKAAGVPVVKAERNTKEQEFIKIVNQIVADCKADYDAEMKLPVDEQSTYISVRTTLLTKLFNLL